MALSKFGNYRKDWVCSIEARGETTCDEMARKYGLLYDNPRCLEESYQERIRDLIMDPRFSMETGKEQEELKDMVKKANNSCTFMQTTERPLQKKFWKRQLSSTFFKGHPPPCPILTGLNQQRYDVDFCYECHCAKTVEDWIENHVEGIKKMPMMLTGNHTSNCVHNAHCQVSKQLLSFERFVEETDVKDILCEKLKDTQTRRSWLTTEGIEAYMLNEDCTDTLIIQNKDLGNHYSYVMCQGDTVEHEENRWIDREWLRDVATRPNKLTQAAYNLERDIDHNVQHLVIGLIDLNTFTLLATSDVLEITRETTSDTLNSALPTEITTLALCGFGFRAALEFAATLLDNSKESILKAVYRPNRSLNLDYYGHRRYNKDDRRIAKNCVNEFDWLRHDETCTTDEEDTEDEDSMDDEGGLADTEDEDTVGEPMAASTPTREDGAARFGR